MEADHVLLVIAGGMALLGLSSRVVKRYALSPMLLALGLGIVVGPHALGFVDPVPSVPRGPLLEQLCRIALALAVFDITLRTRPEDLKDNLRRVGVLLLVVMPGMWLVTAGGAALLFDYPWALALVAGAVLTPTDPGVASALVSGVLPNRSLARRIRMSLQMEAAANDGLALPFVLLSVLLATMPAGEAISEFAPTIARELGIAVLVGLVLGGLLHWLVDVAGVHRLAEEDWFPLASAALAVGVLAAAHLLGGSGVFAAFVAGLVFSEGLPEGLREPIHEVHRSLAKVAIAVVFLAFGAVVPLDLWWSELGVAGLLFALWVLVVRRLPIAAPALLTVDGPLSAAFIGWSGPLGVAGIYYLVYVERFHVERYEHLFAAASLAIACSVLGHALTSAAAVRAYRSRTGREVAEGHELRLTGPLP